MIHLVEYQLMADHLSSSCHSSHRHIHRQRMVDDNNRNCRRHHHQLQQRRITIRLCEQQSEKLVLWSTRELGKEWRIQSNIASSSIKQKQRFFVLFVNNHRYVHRIFNRLNHEYYHIFAEPRLSILVSVLFCFMMI